MRTSCQVVPGQPLASNANGRWIRKTGTAVSREPTQEAVPGHQPSLDEPAPDGLLPQVGGDRADGQEHQVGQGHGEPAVGRTGEGSGRQRNADGQKRHGGDQEEVTPAQPPAQQTGEQLSDASALVGGPGDGGMARPTRSRSSASLAGIRSRPANAEPIWVIHTKTVWPRRAAAGSDGRSPPAGTSREGRGRDRAQGWPGDIRLSVHGLTVAPTRCRCRRPREPNPRRSASPFWRTPYGRCRRRLRRLRCAVCTVRS